MTAPLLNARQQVRLSRVLGDDYHKWMPRRFKIGGEYCSIALSAEHRTKFVALHRQEGRFHMSGKKSRDETPQTNKLTKKHPAIEYFAHTEPPQLPVKSCKFTAYAGLRWPLLRE